MRRPLPLLLLTAVPILLLGGYGGYWFTAAGTLRDGIDTWLAEQRRRGVEVRAGDIDIGGFPLRLVAATRDVAMTDIQGSTWRSSGVSASAAPWRLTAIDFRIDGPQTLTVAGARPVTVTADDGGGDIRLAVDGRMTAGNLSLADLTVLLPAIGDLKAATVELAVAESASANPGIDLALGGDAWQLDLPVSPLPALGRRVDHAGLDVTVTAPVPAVLGAPQLTLWRDAGGRMRIDRLDLAWGPLTVAATGVVTLDGALQPRAELTANVRGFLEMVDALVAAGRVRAQDAGLIKAGLMLLAGPPDADGIATLTAPLSLRDRRLYLGPLQLAELPPVAWP